MTLKRYTTVISTDQIEKIKDFCYNHRKKFGAEPKGAVVVRAALDSFFAMEEKKKYGLINKNMGKE